MVESLEQEYGDGEFRSRAPWLPSTHRLAATHGETSPDAAVLSPTGWPRPWMVPGVCDPLPPDAKRFQWQGDEDHWVNGVITDAHLRSLMLDGDPLTTAMRVARPMSPTDKERSATRRLGCQVGAGDESACSCLCARYDPVLVVPLSLVDKIELNNDLRPTARKLLNEANVGASLRRGGLERGDIFLEAHEKRYPGLPLAHRVCFKVRREKLLWLEESAGIYLTDTVMEQVEKSEYEINVKMLPDLKKWIERYRSVKLTRRGEAARKQALDINQDLEALEEKRSASPGGSSFGAPKYLDPDVHAFKAVRDGPPRAIIVCRCGHAEVWHEKPPAFCGLCSPSGAASRVSTPSTAATATARLGDTASLLPPGPEHLTKTLVPSGTFPMVADRGKPRPPSRCRSEATISGGRLLLRKAGAASLQSAGGSAGSGGGRAASPGTPASAEPKKRNKERRSQTGTANVSATPSAPKGPPPSSKPSSPSRG